MSTVIAELYPEERSAHQRQNTFKLSPSARLFVSKKLSQKLFDEWKSLNAKRDNAPPGGQGFGHFFDIKSFLNLIVF